VEDGIGAVNGRTHLPPERKSNVPASGPKSDDDGCASDAAAAGTAAAEDEEEEDEEEEESSRPDVKSKSVAEDSEKGSENSAPLRGAAGGGGRTDAASTVGFSGREPSPSPAGPAACGGGAKGGAAAGASLNSNPPANIANAPPPLLLFSACWLWPVPLRVIGIAREHAAVRVAVDATLLWQRTP